jgi:hypothetical protein
MAKLKIEDDELNVDDLEGAEYDDSKGSDFEAYDGPEPPKDTLLRGYIKKVWWTYTQKDDPMLVVLFIADGNKGKAAQYDGLPIWERAALTAGAKFKWFPLLSSIGLTIRDVKTKTFVGDAEGIGDPIEKIGSWKPGEDEDGAYVNVLTAREKYNGEWSTKAGKFLEWTDPGEAADEPDEAEDPGDEDAGNADEDYVSEQDDKPRRGGRRAKTAAAEPEEPAQAKGGRGRGGRAAASTAPSKAKATTRGRGRGAAKDEEPPF